MKCPECGLKDRQHEEWCSVGRNWTPEWIKERTGGAGCASLLLLAVGYIVALTTIGICLVVISTELA
jgi:hypothetical protein